MIWQVLEFLCGLAIAGATLSDVFSSILVPGPARSPLRVITHVRQFSLPVWRWLSRRHSKGRTRLSNSFAPLLFSMAFIGWLLLLGLGLALMMHACARQFSPPLRSFGEALYIAGIYLLTIGTSEATPQGAMRFLMLFGALAGFGVVTATITFILEIQTNLHERESRVLQLNGLTGEPPSGVGLLETFAGLHLREELRSFFAQWAEWSTAVLNSHVSFPMLVYFHSVDSESDWVTALEIVLDAATLTMAFTQDECGTAVFLHRSGSRTAAHLCELFHLSPEQTPGLTQAGMEALIGRLRAGGYAVVTPGAPVLDRFNDLRADYDSRLKALAGHLGSKQCPLL